MNLADSILAQRGQKYDLCGIATSAGEAIQKAQRFEMSDDLMRACYSLLDTKPSTLNAALPMCRLPYPTMWVEYSGGLGPPNKRGPEAPVPARQGFLIESAPGLEGLVGCASLAWVHSKHSRYGDEAVNLAPFAIYFDWRPDGNVIDVISSAHHAQIAHFLAHDPVRGKVLASLVRGIEERYFAMSDKAQIERFMMNRYGWKKFASNKREVEAMIENERHMMFGLSRHACGLLIEVVAASDTAESSRLLGGWLSDIQGEGVILECLLAMLNSRNVVQYEPIDLTKLNRARAKRGKAPLLDYTKTTISLTRVMRRVADARGMDREAARQHLVRGHFKIRRTGVYWWSPFLRGDASRGVLQRQEYEVR